MVSLADARILSGSEQNGQSNAQTSRPQSDLVETDVLFVYEHDSKWISRVINRLKTRGWLVELATPGDHSLPRAITTVVSTSNSAMLKTNNHDTLYCILPDQLKLEPNVNTHTSHSNVQYDTLLVNKITRMVEHLISTGYILRGIHEDPRLERVVIDLKSTLHALIKTSESNANNMENTHVLNSYDVISQVCDIISGVFDAEIAYGEHQPKHALIMYIELHQDLCNYVISTYISSNFRSQFWYDVCVFLLTSLHKSPDLVPSDHSGIINLGQPWATRNITSEISMTEDELIQAQKKYIQDLEDFKQAIMFYDQQAPQITQLINNYRSCWENLLIARHTAQACSTLSHLIDTISELHWGEHEVVHILVNTERSVAPVIQSGYIRGALSIYDHVIDQLVQNLHALYDPQMMASLALMDALLKRIPNSSHHDICDIFGQVKSEVERLIRAYQGQDLEHLLSLSQSKVN